MNGPPDPQSAYAELLAAVREIDALDPIGDGVYRVREREGLGWFGPDVMRHAEAWKVISLHVKLD